MQCANVFGTSCGDCSRRSPHVCSQSRWAVGLFWTQPRRTMQCANGIWDQLWRLQQAPITRVQSEPMVSWSALDATTKDNAMCQRDLGPVMAIAAGGHHTCAVRSNGQLVCFGENFAGECNVPTDLGPVVATADGSYTSAVSLS